MSIINFSLLIFSLSYLYIDSFINVNNKTTFKFLFLGYSLSLVLSLYYIKDIYYFYLMYKLLNISIYICLTQFSINPNHFRFLTYYYFIRFMSSLLFIASLYDITNNLCSYLIINFSLLMKLGIYPFSEVISSVYKNSSFNSYIILSYFINYLYVLILFYINSLFIYTTKNLLLIVICLSLPTLIFCYYNFNKQYEVKGAVAYSSITNVPILICTFIPLSCFYSNSSVENYSLLLTFLIFYVFIYSNNILLINTFSHTLEPIKGKK